MPADLAAHEWVAGFHGLQGQPPAGQGFRVAVEDPKPQPQPAPSPEASSASTLPLIPWWAGTVSLIAWKSSGSTSSQWTSPLNTIVGGPLGSWSARSSRARRAAGLP